MRYKKLCIAGFSVFFLLNVLPGAVVCHAQEPSAHGTHEAKKYTCPMHPQIISDKPGDCPICGMRLVEVVPENHVVEKSGETVSHASVMIDAQKQQLIGVVTQAAEKMTLKKVVRAPARVAYDPELYKAQIDFLRQAREAAGSLRKPELDYKNLYISKWEAPRVEQAKSRIIQLGMDEASIERIVKNGKADERLLYNSPDGEVWLYAEVFENEAPAIRLGDQVTVSIPSIPGKVFQAKVDVISPVVDPQTRTVRVWCVVRDPEKNLRPGLWAQTNILTDIGRELAVPEQAVIFTGTQTLVFVEEHAGHFIPRSVTLGASAEGYYQIKDGIQENERVVTSGNFLIDSESRFKAAIGAAHSHGSAS